MCYTFKSTSGIGVPTRSGWVQWWTQNWERCIFRNIVVGNQQYFCPSFWYHPDSVSVKLFRMLSRNQFNLYVVWGKMHHFSISMYFFTTCATCGRALLCWRNILSCLSLNCVRFSIITRLKRINSINKFLKQTDGPIFKCNNVTRCPLFFAT